MEEQAVVPVDTQPLSMDLRSFCDTVEREPWKGLQTAFRNGAKCRLLTLESNYGFRDDFQDAWLRGWVAMDAYLLAGGEITSLVPNALAAPGDGAAPSPLTRLEELEEQLLQNERRQAALLTEMKEALAELARLNRALAVAWDALGEGSIQ